MKKKPVTGMRDILPEEMAIRNYAMDLIRDTYGSFGFLPLETPCVEHIENLSSRQGGENEKLIFKILKRGEKLKLDQARGESDLVDGGLRYDLTVPLSRYYADNANDLPMPFKALQMGNVWRADRPQRGRFRQFMQCDIDTLGEPSCLAEIELILATTTLLGRLGFEGFTIRINDRKILKAMAGYCGFPEESYEKVFIILDKMDKLGAQGVSEELKKEGFSAEAVDRYMDLFGQVGPDVEGVRHCGQILGDAVEGSSIQDLVYIMESVEAVKTADFSIRFDPTLVRGMSYYTGPIFEVSIDGYGGSVGGGGRYDEMIGRFTGQDICACGFSIGFERIVMLLMERGFKIPMAKKKTAYLIEKSMPMEQMQKILEQAERLRGQGEQVNIVMMKKNKRFQKDQLRREGYEQIVESYREKE